MRGGGWRGVVVMQRGCELDFEIRGWSGGGGGVGEWVCLPELRKSTRIVNLVACLSSAAIHSLIQCEGIIRYMN